MIYRETLRAAANVQLEYFENFFKEAAALVEPLPDNRISNLTKAADAWNKAAESGFSAIAGDRKTLDFYFLPGISTASLFQKLFHLGPTPPASQPEHPTTILAILKD
jgi:hypothetical protein